MCVTGFVITLSLWSKSMQKIQGLAEISGRYDGFILDIWGVLHQGSALYPGVHACLTELQAKGKQVWLLSNAPRRPARTQATLEGFGLPPTLYAGILTSGDLCRQYFVENTPKDDSLTPYVYVGPERDHGVNGLLNELPYRAVEDASKAAFAVVTGYPEINGITAPGPLVGSDADNIVLPMLEQLLAANLTLYCANPDLVVPSQGRLIMCAGAIAKNYEKMGGKVHYFGKPHPAVFDNCMAIMKLPQEKLLMIGDTPETDILGANRAGIDSLLVTCGALKDKLGTLGAQASDSLQSLLDEAGATPTYVGSGLHW
jgi:HAD superfamily hydrolase (TIGR01459 family)